MTENLATLITKERERLTKQRNDAIARRQAIDAELESLEKEMMAVDAYEAAKNGKLPRRGKRNGARVPRGQRQQQVTELLLKHPAGLSRGDVIEKMGAKGNRTEEAGISNALHALKAAKKVTAKDGKYIARK